MDFQKFPSKSWKLLFDEEEILVFYRKVLKIGHVFGIWECSVQWVLYKNQNNS